MKIKVFAAQVRPLAQTEFDLLKAGLPDFQQKRFNIKYPGSLFAWSLLKRAVMQLYGFDSLPACVKPESGKPYFSDLDGISFSLSHNDAYAICAVHSCEVGCDIESLSRIPSQLLVSKSSTDAEKKLIADSPFPSEEFMKLWTMKEAKLKRDGVGLAGGIAATDMSDILCGSRVRDGEYYSCFELGGHYITVCGSEFADEVIEIKI